MKLRISKSIKEPDFIPVLREAESYQYQFFGDQGFLGRSPCRSSVRKLTPEDVMNRAEMCPSYGWEVCNLVDGNGKVLGTMTLREAFLGRYRKAYRRATDCSPGLSGKV